MNDEAQASADFEVEPPGDGAGEQRASHDPDNGATDLDSYNAMVASLSEHGDPPAEEEAPAEEGDEAEPGNGEEEESEAAEGDEPDEEEEPSGEEEPPAEDSPKAQTQFRIRAADKVEAEALALRKRHPEWTLKECLEKAESLLGVPKKDTPEDGDAVPARSLSDVEGELKDIRAKRTEALKAMEFETVAELDEQIETLRDEKESLRVEEAQQKASSQRKEAETFREKEIEAERRCTTFYPDTTDPESALVKRMEKLHQAAVENDDPIANSPERSFIYAKQAASELGILMTQRKPAKPAAKKAPHRPVQPASGSARSTTPTAPAAKLEEEIGKLETLDDYEKFVGVG